MSAILALLEEAKTFRPVQAAGPPIFRWDRAEYVMFYAPGCLCVVGLSNAEWFENAIARSKSTSNAVPEPDQPVKWEAELCRRAELGIVRARHWQEETFSPECLTLYMNNECNLNCVYCYADPSHGPAPRLELEAIAAAAEVVAKNCRQVGRPFYNVFHGGGEPALHRERVERALSLLDAVASAQGVETFRYIATNGVMSKEKAVWLAQRFDLVGISCDGPADIQNAQRPLWGGGPTAKSVEQTAHILHTEGQKVHVRATITEKNVRRQTEIVEYLCDRLHPEEIHFEPVYAGGRADTANDLNLLEAADFVTHFLKARQKAQTCGVPLLYTGCRLGEVHGSYCNVFRNVLNLVPGGVATACFKTATAGQARARGMIIGALDKQAGRFVIDHDQVRGLRSRLVTTPPGCRGCFNQFHCARECPEVCPLENDSPGTTLRCQVQKGIAASTLEEAADTLWSAAMTTLTAQSQDERVYGTSIL